MDSDTSETDSKQRVSHRGKNFSTSEDQQICLSWIDASNASDQLLISSRTCFWGALYEHAIANNQDLEVRTANALRLRFLLIQRDVRKFSDIYSALESDEAQSAVEKLEKALKIYERNYKASFKFLRCWNVLKKCPKFQQSTETTLIKQVRKSPEMIVAPRSPGISNHPRGLNVLPDETQALLKAWRDVGVEEARAKDERIEPLMYDVQQQMANYGRFPERKLYLIKKQCIKTEKKYRNGELLPYPPEARILWGKIECDMDDELNDTSWNKQIQHIVDYRKGLSFLSDLETQELLKEALVKDVESVPQDQLKSAFFEILLSMQTMHLCRRKNAEQLLQDYLRLKKLFMTGKCRYLPPEAAQLWPCDKRKKEVGEEMPIIHQSVNMERSRSSSPDWTTKVEMLNLCRICQTELLDETKDLFLGVYNSETYAEIVKRILNIEITNDGLRSTVICGHCYTFIESLVNFVQQCRESCIKNASYLEDFTCEKQEIMEFEGPPASADVVQNESNHSIPVATINDSSEHLMHNNDIRNEATVIMDDSTNDNAEYLLDSDVTRDEPAETMDSSTRPLEDIPDEDTKKVLDENARKKENYRKYLDSRKSGRQRKQQCHLCGKTVISLVEHLESHSGKEFKCHVCDWVCPNRRQLQVHMNRHTKKKAFPCRLCDKVFYVWSSRKDHEISHTKPVFKCDICDAEYKHKNYLQAHKKAKHFGIRNLKCPQCPFRTSIKCRLLNHVRSMHTKERPYKCSVCEHTANSSTGYYIHFQKHKKSGEVVDYSIKCGYCETLFTKDAALEAHIVKNHPDYAVKI